MTDADRMQAAKQRMTDAALAVLNADPDAERKAATAVKELDRARAQQAAQAEQKR